MLDLEEFVKQLGEGQQSQESQPEFTAEELTYLYNLGAKFLQGNDFVKATPIFQFLVLYDPKNTLYIKSLAGCLQAAGEFLKAAIYYKFAYMIDNIANHDTLFYSGICFYKAEEFEVAKAELESFIANSESQEGLMIERAKLYHENTLRHLEKKKEEETSN